MCKLVFTHNNDANICIHILGLFGNPSDGFHGKTVSMLIGNFSAKVTLTPSKKLKIVSESDMERYSMDVFHLFLSLPFFFFQCHLQSFLGSNIYFRLSQFHHYVCYTTCLYYRSPMRVVTRLSLLPLLNTMHMSS
jgi:hypothetical protein